MSLFCSLERAASAGAEREKPPAPDNRSRDRTGKKNYVKNSNNKKPHPYFVFCCYFKSKVSWIKFLLFLK